MLRFQSPLWFLLLLVPAWMLFVRLREGFHARSAVLFSDLRLVRHAPVTWKQRLFFLPEFLFYLAFVLMIVALARPQAGREESRIRAEGIAIAFCLDRSGSMRALDFQLDERPVTRLEVAKKTFRDFVLGNEKLRGRPDDMIALLAFGGYVDAFCPLTLDHKTLASLLEQIRIPEPQLDPRGRILNRGFFEEEMKTAIGDALAEAADRLRTSSAKSKVVLLLSDGEQTAGVLTPEEGAEVAKTLGIKVYTIGIGSTGIVPFAEKTNTGETVYVRQAVTLDEQTLRRIAEMTDGRYFSARDTETLEQVYETIDKLEKTEHEGHLYTRYAELFRYPLLAALACLLVRLLLEATWLRVLP